VIKLNFNEQTLLSEDAHIKLCQLETLQIFCLISLQMREVKISLCWNVLFRVPCNFTLAVVGFIMQGTLYMVIDYTKCPLSHSVLGEIWEVVCSGLIETMYKIMGCEVRFLVVWGGGPGGIVRDVRCSPCYSQLS